MDSGTWTRGWVALVAVVAACGSDDPVERGLPPGGDTDVGSEDTSDVHDPEIRDPAGVPDCEVACQRALGECAASLPCEADELIASCLAACADDPDAFRGAAAAGLACGAFADLVLSRLDEASACYAEVCEPLPTDFGQPGAWSACVSDGGTYVQIEENVSTIARIGAFERIAERLWRRDGVPTPDDFLLSRDDYTIDEGLASRVARREDEHLPPVRDGSGAVLRCRDEGVPALDPERCVGPAQMVPLLTDAFQRGIQGDRPLVQAARIEAGLLWFLYLSTHKEAVTCAVQRRDCDSAWAYYNGGTQRGDGLGLAGYLRRLSPWSHERTFDGLLAMRCWRDLDNGEEATDRERMMRAIDQLDVALLHGVARIVADRASTLPLRTGEPREATWAFVQILGGALVRGVTELDGPRGQELAGLVAGPASDSAARRIAEIAIGGFVCP
jgi:hypothetical protein